MVRKTKSIAGAAALAVALAILGFCGCSAKKTAGFDGARAEELTRRIVAIGPRPPGSENIRKVADLIASELTAIAPELSLQRQRFERDDISPGVEYENLWVEIKGKGAGAGAPILVLAAHYDSKITYPGEQDFAFVGALDAAASCAVLVEMARHLTSDLRVDHDVWLVFFDGEESIEWEWNDSKALIGSRHFAKTMAADKTRFPSGLAARMKAFVLLDLLGDQEFKLDRETESNSKMIDVFARAAETLGVRDHVFPDEKSPVSGDDHIPFKQLGVRVIDLIDFRWRAPSQHSDGMPEAARKYFPFWHTADDSMERVSADSLTTIGDLLLIAIPILGREFLS